MSGLAMLGMLGAGAISSAGSVYNNQQQIQAQQRANSESINLANTAHQREILDLAAAGLNPVLSASGSGASVPALGVANTQNPGQGIADGVSGASNLISSQYRESVKSLRASNEAAQIANEVNSANKEAAIIRAENDRNMALTEKTALERASGIGWRQGKNGQYQVIEDPKKFIDMQKLVEEGIMSDIKNRANQNWRNNAGVFIQGVNSAGSLLGTVASGIGSLMKGIQILKK